MGPRRRDDTEIDDTEIVWRLPFDTHMTESSAGQTVETATSYRRFRTQRSSRPKLDARFWSRRRSFDLTGVSRRAGLSHQMNDTS